MYLLNFIFKYYDRSAREPRWVTGGMWVLHNCYLLFMSIIYVCDLLCLFAYIVWALLYSHKSNTYFCLISWLTNSSNGHHVVSVSLIQLNCVSIHIFIAFLMVKLEQDFPLAKFFIYKRILSPLMVLYIVSWWRGTWQWKHFYELVYF